jgi:hypothetical protein
MGGAPRRLDGDGYIEYRTRNPMTAWSTNAGRTHNSIVYPDGTLALPRACCEIQGYEDAWVRLPVSFPEEKDALTLKANSMGDFAARRRLTPLRSTAPTIRCPR